VHVGFDKYKRMGCCGKLFIVECMCTVGFQFDVHDLVNWFVIE